MKRFAPVLALICASVATPALAGPHDYVVYISRLGGDTETAKPYVAKFSAHLEKVLKWPKGSCNGAFFADRKAAMEQIKKVSPGFALLDPPLYFELRKQDALLPVAQLDSTEITSPKLHLAVKDPALKDLASLKGKRLWTMLAESPAYLSKVVFDGKVDAATHFKMKKVGTALKAIRAVILGTADAALIDDEQLAAAKKMEGGSALRTIYTSPALPPLPVVIFSKTVKGAEQKALAKALLSICDGAGAAVCKEMHLTSFKPVNTAVFKKAEERYER